MFGFFATGNGPNDIQGNYGILDQRLAIAWVKANIEAFGGNPNEVSSDAAFDLIDEKDLLPILFLGYSVWSECWCTINNSTLSY